MARLARPIAARFPHHASLATVPTRTVASPRALLAHEHRSCNLWANRFFSTALDEAHHWAAIRYIERNPVVARLCETPCDWRWSSAYGAGDDSPTG